MAGDQLTILVGQEGDTPSAAYHWEESWGGGGSFVALDNTPLVVAGGGGCAGLHNDGSDASTTETGSNGGQTLELPGATGGHGNTASFGGAGFLTDGGGGASATHAKAFVNGGTGGVDNSNVGSSGGFGGGAAGHTNYHGAGGGGYSGGGQGEYAIVFAHLGIASMSLLYRPTITS